MGPRGFFFARVGIISYHVIHLFFYERSIFLDILLCLGELLPRRHLPLTRIFHLSLSLASKTAQRTRATTLGRAPATSPPGQPWTWDMALGTTPISLSERAHRTPLHHPHLVHHSALVAVIMTIAPPALSEAARQLPLVAAQQASRCRHPSPCLPCGRICAPS